MNKKNEDIRKKTGNDKKNKKKTDVKFSINHDEIRILKKFSISKAVFNQK